MKKIKELLSLSLLSLSLLLPSVLMAETWYGFCVASKDDLRHCTTPEVKTDAMNLRCRTFAENMGANTSTIRYSTSLESLEASMGEYCDDVKGENPGSIYSCQYATLCPSLAETIHHLESKVYADTKPQAIDRCMMTNEGKIKQELRKQSAQDCFLRISVEVIP